MLASQHNPTTVDPHSHASASVRGSARPVATNNKSSAVVASSPPKSPPPKSAWGAGGGTLPPGLGFTPNSKK